MLLCSEAKLGNILMAVIANVMNVVTVIANGGRLKNIVIRLDEDASDNLGSGL